MIRPCLRILEQKFRLTSPPIPLAGQRQGTLGLHYFTGVIFPASVGSCPGGLFGRVQEIKIVAIGSWAFQGALPEELFGLNPAPCTPVASSFNVHEFPCRHSRYIVSYHNRTTMSALEVGRNVIVTRLRRYFQFHSITPGTMQTSGSSTMAP